MTHVGSEKNHLDPIGVFGNKLIELGRRGLEDLPVQEFSFTQHDTSQAQRLVGPTLEVAASHSTNMRRFNSPRATFFCSTRDVFAEYAGDFAQLSGPGDRPLWRSI
jgi:hypothetical protein